MKQKHDNKRFDDIEIRSKLELLAELQVHQIELKMQNSALKDMQQELEESRDRYADLYDYAPVGYLSLDNDGNVLGINLTGCAMLGLDRASVVNQPFMTHLVVGQHQAFSRHLKQIFNSEDNTVSELIIKGRLKREKYIRLESKRVHKTNTCRMIMTDIDQLRKTTSLNDSLLIENRRLMQNLFTVQEKERRFIVGELHDELSQWISAIYAEAEAISNHANKKESIIYHCAQSISECTKKMHQVIRKMLHELRPPLLDTLGLEDALLELKKQWCSNHAYISLEFSLEGDLTKLGEQLNITIYRIVQESLNNICSHSDATSAKVCLRRETGKTSAVDMLVLNVKDNGKGYDTNQANPGIGLLGMRERAISAGGKFTVNSSPNDGTQIHARLPISKNEKSLRS